MIVNTHMVETSIWIGQPAFKAEDGSICNVISTGEKYIMRAGKWQSLNDPQPTSKGTPTKEPKKVETKPEEKVEEPKEKAPKKTTKKAKK